MIGDDRLRLFFTCCHPALAPEARVALTLRYLAGLSTAEVARAFLVPEATMAQRLVRAKRKIREAQIPYRVPSAAELPTRLPAVLSVVYVVFTESYAASSGPALVRPDLADEAIRLARILHRLLPAEREIIGLLALLLLVDARRAARVDAAGDLVLLEDQDRSRWDRTQIEEGRTLVGGANGRRARPVRAAGRHRRPARRGGRASRPRTGHRSSASTTCCADGALASGRAEPGGRRSHGGRPRGRARPARRVGRRGALDRYHLLHAARGRLLDRLGRPARRRRAYRRALEWSATSPSGPSSPVAWSPEGAFRWLTTMG